MFDELVIHVPDTEFYNYDTEEFVMVKGATLRLKHSLFSVSHWESKWKIPFLEKKPEKTKEQMIHYVKCMTINKNVDPNLYLALTADNWKQIEAYIEDKMSATWFNDDDPSKPRKKEIITSEIIYFWMISQNIPMECERWHLNRLLTLIHVCSIKNAPPKKMSKNSVMSRNRALNAARKKKYGTKG